MGWETWIRTVEIEPAIGGAEAAARKQGVEALLRAGCRIFHLNTVDVPSRQAMDAVALLAQLVHFYKGVLDVHASGDDVTHVAAAGADSVTFDAGSVYDIPDVIARVRATGRRVGIAFGSWTPEEEVAESARSVDLVLTTGSGGGAVARVRRLAELLPESVTIQVEGGLRRANVRPLYEAGARLLVVDRPIFEREDLPRAYRQLLQALE